MDKSTFYCTMPYSVDFLDNKIIVKNRFNNPLYHFFSSSKFSIYDIDFSYDGLNSVFFSDGFVSKVYLYDDTTDPIGKNHFFYYDKLISYFLRLTELFNFCNKFDFNSYYCLSYILPYYFKQKDGLISIFNERDRLLFSCSSDKVLSIDSPCVDFYSSEDESFYLFVNSGSFDSFSIDENWALYYMRLTFLFIFCSGIENLSI